MNRFWPWFVAAGGLGILVADFYSLGAEVLYIENSFIPDNINPWPLRISALIGLIFFVGGVVVGIYRSVSVVREPRQRKKG